MPKKPTESEKSKKEKPNASAPGNSEQEGTPPQETDFRVVGIGASAGGLEALQQFFGNLPADTGMAFAIVQHLGPSGHSQMPEILSRFTKMPVMVAINGMQLQPKQRLSDPTKQEHGDRTRTYLPPRASAAARGEASRRLLLPFAGGGEGPGRDRSGTIRDGE